MARKIFSYCHSELSRLKVQRSSDRAYTALFIYMPLFVFPKPPYLEYPGTSMNASLPGLSSKAPPINIAYRLSEPTLLIVPEGDTVEGLLEKPVQPSIRQVNNAAAATIANLV
jgi:hypothetical protein